MIKIKKKRRPLVLKYRFKFRRKLRYRNRPKRGGAFVRIRYRKLYRNKKRKQKFNLSKRGVTPKFNFIKYGLFLN